MLTIVATPIGNLSDISARAKEALTNCHGIVCEDTRVTGKLLSLLGLPKKELISFHGHSDEGKLQWILTRLSHKAKLCLVSDAGTPGISDPGSIIVGKAREMGIPIEVIPGPSAFLTALSASGLPIHQFVYLGFLPIKKGRKTLLASLQEEQRTVVFYESPHRIVRTLSEISSALEKDPERIIVIARELTKMHEEVLRTTIRAIPSLLEGLTVKGEFVIVLGGSTR